MIERRADKDHDPDLYRACRGAGGGNFGIITSFRFDKLPPAPREVAQANLIFDWATMTEDRFAQVLTSYGDYWEGRGKDRDTWGLFTLMDITPAKRGHFGIYIQYCQPDGTAKDLSVLEEFLNRFAAFQPMLLQAHGSLISRQGPSIAGRKIKKGQESLNNVREIAVRPALDVTIGGGGSGAPIRGKYKYGIHEGRFHASRGKHDLSLLHLRSDYGAELCYLHRFIRRRNQSAGTRAPDRHSPAVVHYEAAMAVLLARRIRRPGASRSTGQVLH
ncbi:MAG TPA: hypothetical protein VMU57_00825 [Edaphobacter sp.]|uniref:hypothetical protein n=1 Tax=Edaphobacter sp. TaxID=1934404 RepID=UPI002CFA2400|nr:hypothetical protein [Edaphobacter sp.]HUZ93434.1 hypothetical protein [Edaphobacter sp.]